MKYKTKRDNNYSITEDGRLNLVEEYPRDNSKSISFYFIR